MPCYHGSSQTPSQQTVPKGTQTTPGWPAAVKLKETSSAPQIIGLENCFWCSRACTSGHKSGDAGTKGIKPRRDDQNSRASMLCNSQQPQAAALHIVPVRHVLCSCYSLSLSLSLSLSPSCYPNIFLCISTCVCTCLYDYVYVYMCMQMCIYIHTCICVCMFMCIHVYLYMCMYVFMYVGACMYVCMYACINVCTYVYKYLYTHMYM